MINAQDHKTMSSLAGAILDERRRRTSQYNPNPSVRVHVWGDREWYEAFIHYNPFDKEWCLGVSFHGLSNQGKPYLDMMSAKRYKNIETLCMQIRSWAEVGPKRIHLSVKRWEEQRYAI